MCFVFGGYMMSVRVQHKQNGIYYTLYTQRLSGLNKINSQND